MSRVLLPHPYVGDTRAGGDHLADDLVAGYQRVGWPELAVVQMQIRPADPGNHDAEQHLTRAGFGEGNLADRELARPVVDHGLHRVHLCTPGRVDSREARSVNC